MNIKTIIVGTLALGSVIGGSFFKMSTQGDQAVYTPRSINNGGVQGIAGYAEYMNMLRADPATGKVDLAMVNQARNAVIERSQMTSKKASLGLNWNQMGPDNVGGRTRAILIDQDNPNIVYAGSVAGGLFVSNDATLSWTPIASMQGTAGENLAISCITQTDNGRIFFGTGSTFDGLNGFNGNGGSEFIGNGVYEYVPSTGAVLPVITKRGAMPNNDESSTWTATNAIAHKGNRLYLGTRQGMMWADPDAAGNYPTTISGWTNPLEVVAGLAEVGTCQDIDIASDGSMAVCFGTKMYTSSNDAFGSFTKQTFSQGARLGLSIAPSNPNIYYLIQSNSNGLGHMVDFRVSQDKGVTWEILVPSGSPCNDPFVQNTCNGGQGLYDMAIAVDPADWGHVIVGGVQLYEFIYTPGSNPFGGSWLKSANLVDFPGNQVYVHADKHTIVWGNNGVVYVGGDGGVSRSEDNGLSWQARNYGYNVTTFYDVAVAGNGFFMGGAQDNGTQLFDFGLLGSTTPLGTVEVQGGDGFDCAFSNLGTGIGYTTSQNGSLNRSSFGGNSGPFYDNFLAGKVSLGNEPFHTVIKNWENVNDTTSLDSISIAIDTVQGGNFYLNAPGDTLSVGDTIFPGKVIYYESLTLNIPLTYTYQDTLVLDSFVNNLKFIDPVQNRFVVRFNDGCYLTRDAAKFGGSDPERWFKISNRGNIENFEFSPDGSSVFLGTNDGKVFRVDSLNKVTNDDSQAIWNTIIRETQIGSGLGGVVGLAIDPNDGNNLIATAGSYTNSDHVYRCTNALTAATIAGTFEAIQGVGNTALPFMPVYDAEIHYGGKDTVIIGTEWGVWTTDNAFSALTGAAVEWSDASGNGMAHVPVFAVEQQQLKSWQSQNSGIIYLGTHARGFYTATDLQVVSVQEEDSELTANRDKNSLVSNLTLYPNPLNSVGTLEFDLIENLESTINVYNLAGTLVKTMQLGRKAKGNHKVEFNATDLSVGSYIISLESGNERSVAKFIVTR